MKLTKAVLMKLPKERLAELIVEMQEEPVITPDTVPLPPHPYNPYPYYPWGSPVITYTTKDGNDYRDKESDH